MGIHTYIGIHVYILIHAAFTLAYNGRVCPLLHILVFDLRVGMPAHFWLCVWVVVVVGGYSLCASGLGYLVWVVVWGGLVLSLWAGTPILELGCPPPLLRWAQHI